MAIYTARQYGKFFFALNWTASLIFDEFRKKSHENISNNVRKRAIHRHFICFLNIKAKQCYVCRSGNIECFLKTSFVSFDTYQDRTFCRLGLARGHLSMERSFFFVLRNRKNSKKWQFNDMGYVLYVPYVNFGLQTVS